MSNVLNIEGIVSYENVGFSLAFYYCSCYAVTKPLIALSCFPALFARDRYWLQPLIGSMDYLVTL